MRKCTRRISAALYAGRSLKVGNTTTDGTSVFLFGNKIIERRGNVLWYSLAGWPTVTTKERIRGIVGASVYCYRGQLYDRDTPIDEYSWYTRHEPRQFIEGTSVLHIARQSNRNRGYCGVRNAASDDGSVWLHKSAYIRQFRNEPARYEGACPTCVSLTELTRLAELDI